MNKYLEKIAAIKEKPKKDSVGLASKAGIAYGSAAIGGAASVLPIKALSKNMQEDFAKTGVTEKDVKSYQKSKGLRHVPRTDGDGAYASPHNYTVAEKEGGHPFGNAKHEKMKRFGGKVYATNDAVAMHEYGHAHSYRQSGKTMRTAKFTGYLTGRMANTPLGRLALAGAATSKNDNVSKGAVAASALASVPMLHEEAKASISPYRHLKKTRGADVANKWGKVAGKAFGTYATTAAATVGGTMLARHLTQKVRVKNDAKAAKAQAYRDAKKKA